MPDAPGPVRPLPAEQWVYAGVCDLGNIDGMEEPTQEQLEASGKLEKRTVGGELRYYVKNIRDHWPVVIEQHPDVAGHEAWWTKDGKFHATHDQLRRDAMVGGIV